MSEKINPIGWSIRNEVWRHHVHMGMDTIQAYNLAMCAMYAFIERPLPWKEPSARQIRLVLSRYNTGEEE